MKISNVVILLFISGLVVMAGCNKKQAAPPNQMMQQGPGPVSAHDVSGVAGIHWAKPERWGVQPPRQMRVATYSLPAADGDAEGGECGVFFFGSGQGGDNSANIDRWVQQFENANPEQSSREVNGMTVTLVRIAGTYLAPSGPMMQSSGKKENYRLLGAIVAAPEGSVFFKLTGPSKTVGESESEFTQLVNSFSK